MAYDNMNGGMGGADNAAFGHVSRAGGNVDLFGDEEIFMNQKKRVFNVYCLNDTKVYFVSKYIFKEFLKDKQYIYNRFKENA